MADPASCGLLGDVQRSARFAAACVTGDEEQDASAIAERAIAALTPLPAGANLGFVYVTDLLANDIENILTCLKFQTGISNWLGSVGLGVMGSGVEVYDQPALSLLVGQVPEGAFTLFDPVTKDLDGFQARHGAWLSAHQPALGIVHGDPRNAAIPGLLKEMAASGSVFLVGGLASSRGPGPQICQDLCEGGLSGMLLACEQTAVVGLTQGCSPLGPVHTITETQDSVICSLDDRPAVDVLKEDIGELLARDLSRIGGYIYASFPIPGSDTGDYLVRNLVGIDPASGWLQVAEYAQTGMSMGFCRRDHAAATEDLERMLKDVTRRLDSPPQAALYFSCIARGQHLFGTHSEELSHIAQHLGDVPLTGFFANGEISNDRLYAYTGVLVLLL